MYSTVIALGHFCEVHGPRLVFYTIRNSDSPQFISQCPSSEFKFCAGCKAPILEGYISTVQTVQSSPVESPTKYYCSHSNYDHSHLSHLHTCIARSLSCELSPSNSVAFTSGEVWAVGTAFSLKDSTARGFKRKYCLVFTFLPESEEACASGGESSSKSTQTRSKPAQKPPSLVPYYDYITESFYLIAKQIQTSCEKVYYKEQAQSPQRSVRLSALLDPGGTGPKVFTRSSAAGARSLPLLTENPHVFLDMHEKFAKVLHHVDL